MNATPDVLFVYGTLRSEFANAYSYRLQQSADLIGPATVRGSIFLLTARYPGYRPEPEGIVRGELWRLRNPAEILSILDDYEGPEYARVAIETVPPEPVTAWIYLYRFPVSPDLRIESGDFLTL